MQGNLYELSDQDLDTAATLADATHDDRSLRAILAERKDRQELRALNDYALNERYGDAAMIADRPVMHRIDRMLVERVIEAKHDMRRWHPLPMTGTPRITDAETNKKHRW